MKIDYERSSDGYQRLIDGNVKVSKYLAIPVFLSPPSLNDNVNEAGPVGIYEGAFTFYDGTTWKSPSALPGGGTSFQYLRGDQTFQTLNTAAVPESTNLYYTQARFDSAFTAKSTTNLAEGTNLYYTASRVQTLADARYLQLSGGTLMGDVQQATAPVNGTSLINKSYVDNLITGISWKQEVRAATTANITLSGTQTIDGVALAINDRVLVKNQTTQTQNGIYLVASGAWTRSLDADSSSEIGMAAVLVRNGTTQKNTQWTCTNSTDPVIGTDAITFGQISASGTYTNGTGILLTSNVFSLDLTYSDGRYVSLSGSYSNPSWITSLAHSKITYTGTTAQYVRGDGSFATFPTAVSSFTNDSGYLTSASSVAWAKITGTPTTVAGYGITDVYPSQTGNSGKYLTTNGTSTSWATVSAGGTPGGVTNSIQYQSATGTFLGSLNFTYNGTNVNLALGALYLGSGTISASAIAQFDSTSQGILGPRMTQAQRVAISSPAIGLQVYQTDAGTFGEGYYQYRSTGWTPSSGGAFPNDITVNTINVGLGNSSVATNTSIGYQALLNATSGSGYNVAIGYQSLKTNTSGGQNVAIGYQSLLANTTGAYNIAIGMNPLGSNTTGSFNTAIGYLALSVNTTGSNSTAIGSSALSNNTSGSSNVALGNSSLANNTTGAQNTATGFQALGSIIDGSQNTASGYNALYLSQHGNFNTAFGNVAMGSNNVSGSNNTAVGYASLLQVTSGSNNVSVGHNSFRDNTTGSGNTALGEQSGWNQTTTVTNGSFNTYLGANTSPSTTGINNSTAIGYGSTITASNQIVYGNGSITQNIFTGLIYMGAMTTTAKNAVTGPVAGGIVYDSTLNRPSVYNGTAWKNLAYTDGGNVLTFTSSTTRALTAADFGSNGHLTIYADASTAAFQIPLPAAATWGSASATGLILFIIKVDSSSNTVTAKGNGTELINANNLDTTLSLQYNSNTYQSNGTQIYKF